MFQFLHAADIHLDSPLRGLERYEGAPVDEIRGATRRALENLTALAIDRKVDFVLIAGDLYDGDWKDHNTGLFFVKQMSRLREAEIPVVVVSGNHDAASKITKSLRLPDNVEVLGHSQASTAQSKTLDELGVAVHGRSFAKAAEVENLALQYPDKRAGMFNIGLLHTCLTGAEGHERYAPCSIDDLQSKGYDYWALGHVHQRQAFGQDRYMVFPGNVQGRHIRETGPKGCYLVSVDGNDAVQLEFQPLDVVRWSTCDVAVDGLRVADDLLHQFDQQLRQLRQQQELPLAVRVRIVGRSGMHEQLRSNPEHWMAQFRSVGVDATGGTAWIEKVEIRTSPQQATDPAALTAGPLGELMQYFQELQLDDQELLSLARELDDLKAKLPAELQNGDDALRFDDPEWLRQVLGDVEPLLLARLRGETPS